MHPNNLHLFLTFCFVDIDNGYEAMLGANHDKIILLSTPFPIIPMLDKHFFKIIMLFLIINDIVV